LDNSIPHPASVHTTEWTLLQSLDISVFHLEGTSKTNPSPEEEQNSHDSLSPCPDRRAWEWTKLSVGGSGKLAYLIQSFVLFPVLLQMKKQFDGNVHSDATLAVASTLLLPGVDLLAEFPGSRQQLPKG
jgi:hypothetical protein